MLNRSAIKDYIERQPIKVVKNIDLNNNLIEYSEII